MNKRAWIQWAAAMPLGLVMVPPSRASETPTTLAGTRVVSAEEVKKLLDTGVPVVDTRVAAEFVEKSIKGARSVPYKEKSAREPGFDPSVDQFDLDRLPPDKNAPIVFFCDASECWKSYKASKLAVKVGYTKVHWFRGGLPEWVGKGLPTQ